MSKEGTIGTTLREVPKTENSFYMPKEGTIGTTLREVPK